LAQSVSKAVNEILSNTAYLHFSFEHKLTNDSAIAKFIKPRVEEKVGKPVSLGAVIAAVRRFTLSFKPTEKTRAFIQFLKSVHIQLRTGLVDVTFKRTYKTAENLAALAKKIRWEQGEKMHVLQARAEEVTVIAHAAFLKDVLACAPKKDVIGTHSSIASLTVLFDRSLVEKTYGVMQFWTGIFASLGVPIHLGVLTYSSCSFIFSEEHAPRVYKVLSDSLAEIHAMH